LVNGQLTSNAKLANQPSELLDRRDLLLRQLSKLTRINTSFTANGTVTVSLGGTITQSVVVDGQKNIPIGRNDKSADPFGLLLDPYGNTQALSDASGGTLGGLKTFMSQILDPAQKSLNLLAKTFVDQVNTVQRNGVDAYGNSGVDLLRIDPSVANEAAGMQVTFNDGLRVATGSKFRVAENVSNPSSVQATVNYTPASPIPAISNPFLVNNPNPASGIKLVNQGSKDYTVLATVAAGLNSPSFYLDNAQPGQQLQLITKDGRQILGQPLTTDQQFKILTPENGFNQPATYSTQYLNTVGVNGYLGADVFYGVKSDPINSQQFDAQGNPLAPKPIPAVLTSNRIDLTQTGTVVPDGALVINERPMGALVATFTGNPPDPTVTPTLSLNDISNWINAAGLTDVHVSQTNLVTAPGKNLRFDKALSINGVNVGVIPPGGLGPSEYYDSKTLVNAINAKTVQTNVVANLSTNGDIQLFNIPGHEGDKIQIGQSGSVGSDNALNVASQSYTGQIALTRDLGDPKNSSIKISFGKNGTPADLARAGFRTGAYINGPVPDDLQLVMTGNGTASVAASYSGQPSDQQEKLRAQSLSIKFTARDHYVITDVKTGTELASRDYDNTVLNPIVNYQGLSIRLSAPPTPGDVFQVDGNQDGLGNNQNIKVMAELAKKKVLNGLTISDNYIDQVNKVGNTAQQATITQQALTVVNNQAVAARDKISGVNLDDEAASLIRYQQSYQAAAKAMQVSSQLFDSIVQIH
jgi:flagellar hook-associated protein FlgK